MATFALYNYEFEQLPDDDFFGQPLRKKLSEESFAHRQARFGQLLMDDYSGTKPLIYANKRGTQYIHQFIAKPDDGIFANDAAQQPQAYDARQESPATQH